MRWNFQVPKFMLRCPMQRIPVSKSYYRAITAMLAGEVAAGK